VTPLLRYALNDVVTLGPASCPCGRGLPLLSAVQGKLRPMFVGPHGRRRSSTAAANILERAGGHIQHQLVQKAPDHFLLRLVPTSAWSADHAAQVKRELEAFFESPLRLDLEIRERLEVPASGKFQSMVSEINDQ
jgi:phenylacetate-CoA ligase